MRRAVVLATLLAAAAAVSVATAHQSGCHSAHSCPSDHHTYIWYDSAGGGWDCAKPGAPEYLPTVDTTTIIDAGLTYYCHPAGSPTPPPTTTTPTAPPSNNPHCHYRSSGGLPDTRCTPGAKLKVGRAQVCVPGYSSGARHVSSAEKAQVYARYGITHHAPYSYEVDHLIPLELGGSNTLANLWPEPIDAARVKDRLENALHRDVCAGRLALRTAQREIAANWYRTWIQEGRP